MADEEHFNIPVRQTTSLDFDGVRGGRSFSGGNHPNSIITEEGLTIVVVNGNICDQTVDALANSVGGNYKLSEGALAKAILQRAGAEIQQELDSAKPKDPRAGDVVVTKGYRLSASYVFHGVLSGWINGPNDAEAGLRHLIKNVLEAAHKRKLRTLAIPALGTGALNYPADAVANCMFSESDKFSAEHSQSQTTVSEVRLVVYEKAAFDVFQQKLSELKQAAGSVADVAQLTRALQLRTEKNATRIESLGLTYPDSWDPPDPYDPYRRNKLSPDSSEYKQVLTNVKKTSGLNEKHIIKIERIENHALWQLYMVHKDSLVKNNKTGVEVERLLWHGTSIDSLDNIYAGGFNRAYCGKNATMYGQGVYFAVDFSYSAQRAYSPPDPNGVKYVFQCRVLTGQFVAGSSDMKEPPLVPGYKFRYDTVTNDAKNPKIFVTFKDWQSYPEYLVCFKD